MREGSRDTVLPEDLLFPERTSVTAPCPMGTPAPGGAPRRLRPGSDVTFTEGEKRLFVARDRRAMVRPDSHAP